MGAIAEETRGADTAFCVPARRSHHVSEARAMSSLWGSPQVLLGVGGGIAAPSRAPHCVPRCSHEDTAASEIQNMGRLTVW